MTNKRVEERALLRLQRRPVVEQVKTKRTVCRDYARWSADDLRRVVDDPQRLARGGDLVKPTEGQMTTVSKVNSASDEAGTGRDPVRMGATFEESSPTRRYAAKIERSKDMKYDRLIERLYGQPPRPKKKGCLLHRGKASAQRICSYLCGVSDDCRGSLEVLRRGARG